MNRELYILIVGTISAVLLLISGISGIIKNGELATMDEIAAQHAEVLLRKDLEATKMKAQLVGLNRARTLCADQLGGLSATIMECCYGAEREADKGPR